LLNDDFRLSATDNAFDRTGIEYIRDGRFYTLFQQDLCFLWRASQGNERVSSGEQFRDQRTTDRSRSPRDENLHLSTSA
jgi:hypothetical protein